MSPYLRTVKTSSGATAVQIVHSSRRGSRDIEHLGSAHDDVELELLKAAARQRLTQLKQAGVDTILDMTIPGLGRDPALVARAAEGTGVRVMFATGYYTLDWLPYAFQFRGPGKFLDGDDRLLESLFERDVTKGMGDTGIRAAVLKLVTDVKGMTRDVTRLARAVANVSVRTGAPICTHAKARLPSVRRVSMAVMASSAGAPHR